MTAEDTSSTLNGINESEPVVKFVVYVASPYGGVCVSVRRSSILILSKVKELVYLFHIRLLAQSQI